MARIEGQSAAICVDLGAMIKLNVRFYKTKTVYFFNESVGRVVTLAPYVISSKIN